MSVPLDIDAIEARWVLARMAGEDADDWGHGWNEAKIRAMVRSWQDVRALLLDRERTPDLTAAVEAAARAWFARGQAGRRDDGRLRPDGQPWQWEDLTAGDQHAYRSLVLPLVTAAFDA